MSGSTWSTTRTMTTSGERYEITLDVEPSDEIVYATDRLKSAVTKRKGRGFGAVEEGGVSGMSGITHFDTLDEETSGRAMRSVEGWVLFVTGLHEECTEDDLYDCFADFGSLREIKLNLDHRTGYVKGYALVEFTEYKDAKAAVDELDGSQFMDSTIHVDFAFVRPQFSN